MDRKDHFLTDFIRAGFSIVIAAKREKQVKNVILQFFDLFELELARDDSRVGRKLVKGVSAV